MDLCGHYLRADTLRGRILLIDTYVRAFVSIMKVGLSYTTSAHGSMEVESVVCTQRHSHFCQHTVPQQYLVHVGVSLHHVSVTCVGVVRILFEGGYYFTQHRQSRGQYSRVDTIRCADTNRGNTVYNT